MVRFDIPQLFSIGRQRLDAGAERPKKLLNLYLLVFAAVSVGVNLISYGLTSAVDGFSGLSNVGARSALGALQSLVNLLSILFPPVWYYCFCAGSLRIYRGQDVQPKSMVSGFCQWKRLLMAGLMYLLPVLGCSYLMTMLVSTYVVLITSARLDPAALQALLEAPTAAVQSAVTEAFLPLLLVCSLLFALIALFFLFRYRMAFFLMTDYPQIPGSQILRCASRMMRGHMGQFLRLDLRFWWYYLAQVLISLVPFAGLIAELAGVPLPLDPNLIILLSGIVHTLLISTLNYFFKNQMLYTYAAAYDQILQEESQQIWQRQQSCEPPRM